ncbi:MAG: hypothetical protein CFK52_03585 [Chloracidobacterium sp. CP2_5A]|nr:MAG: hypothetical protein CFK52_03585 [Chloracidobacterium sp. CP2_5A]
MESIARLLPDIVKFADGQDDILQAACGAAWTLAVGEATRQVSRVVRLADRTLTVAARDARWKRQLEALAPQIIFQLNSVLRQPLVLRIHIIVDEKLVGLARRQEKPAPPPAAALPEELIASAGAIADEALRAQFLRLVAACLARDRAGDGRAPAPPG